MSQIRDLLRAEIDAHGPISFARFMEVALYCPKIGYYERAPSVIGSSGDFYTSASLGPAFGQLLAWQFAQWCEALPAERVTWVEAGAHDGTLALAMLEWLGKNQPALLERLTYCIIEPSATRQLWQEQTLRPYHTHVRWSESLDQLTPIDGIIFSNELLDAFPVHRVAWDASNHQWFEWGVSWDKNETSRSETNRAPDSPSPLKGERTGVRGETVPLAASLESTSLERGHFLWAKLSSPSLEINAELESAGFALPPALLDVLPDGFIIDLSPTARNWWPTAAQLLASGKLLTIDYGGTVDELLRPERTDGTLRAFFQHHATADLLARPGEQDLTAHVNFTQLQRMGEEAGLTTEAFITQEIFLSKIIQSAAAPTSAVGAPPLSEHELRKLRPLIHPEHLGHSFGVLIQSREASSCSRIV